MIDFRSLKFGCEIEVVGKERKAVAKAIQSVVGGKIEHVGQPSCYDPYHLVDSKGRLWKVVADSSLGDVTFDLRAEIVTPILTYNDIPTLQEVVRSVRKIHCRASDTCGLHLHVDASLFTGRTLANLLKIFYKQQELIIQALGVKPNRLAKYTKRIDPDLIRRIEKTKPTSLEDI
ncbi:MAG: amidoligase family protein, partial [Armatimonadota bacterium]